LGEVGLLDYIDEDESFSWIDYEPIMKEVYFNRDYRADIYYKDYGSGGSTRSDIIYRPRTRLFE